MALNKKILNNQENENAKNQLIVASKMSNKELFEIYNSSSQGLETEEIIENNKEKYGVNILSKKSKNTVLKRFVDAFLNPFSIILFVLAIISMITDIILPIYDKDQNTGAEPATMIIILCMILISGILHIVEDTRSSSSAEKLVNMIQTTTKVERNGIRYEIPLDKVVVGDIIILAAGDIIPADVKILNAKDLFVSQSSLTGESESIEKFANLIDGKNYENVTDRHNLAFMGSNVISGSAKAMVIVTGDRTYLGQVAQKINAKPVKTSFEKGIASISWLLLKIMLVVVPIVFIISGLRGYLSDSNRDANKWLEAFMFAISVAVGLTPEMLPVIVTSTLAKGAVSMSKRKTIVKSLNSIQNFGAMDVFCTDKTGTLTLDQVVLERHLNISGEDDINVLKHGFLNSYYQTGLKNLLDLSIIEKTEELSELHEELDNLSSNYVKVDEIPFDFVRKRMSVLVKRKKEDSLLMITKGAMEEILSICNRIEYNGEIINLDEKMSKKVMKQVDELNDQGMRVIGVARKNDPSNVGEFSVRDENDMTLIGYLAFLDPPKESTASAIENLYENGVDVKILTGDNARVTKAICAKVGIPSDHIVLGKDVMNMDDETLRAEVEKYNIFAKLSPDQKARIINALRINGHVVGYMGDGINDAPAMKAADVSISVDTAVDIAKESANIILLEKDLNVLNTGIIEGRKTYANMNKYIKMTVSSNFGNIISILIASMMLPFVPLVAAQILFMNLIYDISCGAIPWDNVDKEFLRKPKTWETKSIIKFMLWFGPASTLIDLLSFVILQFVFLPLLYPNIEVNGPEWQSLFQTAWFIISMWTQSIIIHFIRTEKLPFVKSKPGWLLLLFSILGIVIVTTSPYIPILNTALKLSILNPYFYILLGSLVILYILLVMLVKFIYIKKYKELL
ncbi:Magnesium-transporting ATPase, P-type 1 [Mycoplasmopsis maculosa]|uniref:Magnesium-transporting ATPase, P-type 1 n=1 Tax=Mycoplasmopsis maculosa TaxID=114885 RepID=A0A449B3Z5_9BACT|nr:magnesium-translocating P-type ATPase [Mycoplasmopsis maculosa]VEU75322.1 Magnesium-transporting ATPase, P-type 1 [Mycoplasmopsis maculosa]